MLSCSSNYRICIFHVVGIIEKSYITQILIQPKIYNVFFKILIVKQS